MKNKLAMLLTISFLMLMTGFVSADEHASACKPDVEKFCNGVKSGEGRIWKCLKEHKTELSVACKDHIHTGKKKLQARREACKDDKEKFCKEVPHARGSVTKCLKQHKADLAPACQAAIGKKKSK